MRNILIFAVLISFFSCNNTRENVGKNAVNEFSFTKHKDLIGSKISCCFEEFDYDIAGLDDDELEKVFRKYDQEKEKKIKESLRVEYIDDIIYVSFLEELNACGGYYRNIETANDTIKLIIISEPTDVLCASLSVYKFTYIIDNPKKEKRVIIR
jgi:hypothetical protein